MKKPGRWLAYIMLLTFIITANPAWLYRVQAADPVINNIYIERTDNEVLETVKGVVEIDGQDLKDLTVRVLTTGGGGSKKLGVDIGQRTSNDADFIKFELSGTEMRSIVWANGLITAGATIPVDQENMAAITSISPGVVYTGTDTVTISGSNLDKDNLTFGNGSLNGTVTRAADGTKITITDITGDLGLHDVLFTKVSTPAECNKVTFCKLYQNQFRVVQKLDIADLEMYPNTGVPGKTTVYFQAPGLGEYSVFFLRNVTDPYYTTNMGTDYEHVANPIPADSLIKVTVPNLTPGTYHVLLTNYLTDPQSGQDLRNRITQEKLVGDFIIVSSANAAQINSVTPSSGPTLNNNPVSVIGYNFEELNIDHLTGVSDTITSAQTTLSDSDTLLTINYGPGTYTPGSVDKAVNVYREIRVIISAAATFQPVEQQAFVHGNYDTLQVMTDDVTDEAIKDDPIQDVVVDITTTLVAADATYVFTEQALKENGFTFIKSYTEPVMTKATPDKIQVEKSTGNYLTKEDMYIGITGSSFIVSKYTDPTTGKQTIHYPIVDLGGTLYFRREIFDGANSIYDRSGNTLSGATVEVYNNSTLVDGSTGNDTGNRILIKIPAELEVAENKVNISTYIEMTNPRKNSNDYGYAIKKDDLIEFVEVSVANTPVITSVTPNIVSTDGTKGVVIEGYNFQANVQLYLEDTLVSCTRDASGQKITFDAPTWRAGQTRLLVMNVSGGQDSAGIIYASSQTKPTITSITPPAGTINTMVTINGTQFLYPDPTAVPVDLGIYRLIGTRVLFDEQDINDYYYAPGTNEISLQAFSAANLIMTASGGTVDMADYYYSVLLKQSDDQYYILKYSDQGDIILTDGTSQYTISASGEDLKATDSSGGEWTISVTASTVTLTQGATNIVLSLYTPYQNSDGHITGNRVKVADHGKRIYAVVPDLLASGVYDVSVVNPDTNRATLKDAFTFYRQPQRLPEVDDITPDSGSVAGGYYIRITGKNFEDNGTVKTRVFINTIEVAAADTSVGLDGTTIDVKVPAYPGNLKDDWGTDHKAVPVALLNPSDGGAVGLEDAFTYILTGSQPVIDTLSKSEGTAAGGDRIEIIGRDFRFYEPYEDQNNNLQHDAGEPYTDLNANGAWDDFSLLESVDNLPGDKDKDLEVLPQVYFGTQKATIQDFGIGRLDVITPAATAGTVDVYIVNNDLGVSNKKKFTYKSSTPKITSITPAIGRKQGNENVEILGSGFVAGQISVVGPDDTHPDGVLSQKTMALARFGDISNLSDETSGTIVNGVMSNLDLTGNMTVSYSSIAKTLDITVSQGGIDYHQQFSNYDGSACFFDLRCLKDSDDQYYPGFELVKVYVKDRRLIIERGYSHDVTTESGGQLIVVTPSYYTVGQVTLRVINPDGGTASGQFEYKNPATSPYITDITRDGQEPKETTVDGVSMRVLQVNYKGDCTITILGDGFLNNATVQVGNLVQVESGKLTATPPTKLSFAMPAVVETSVGSLLKVVVTNEDGGIASSDSPPASLNLLPLYIQFTKGETAPQVTGVTPAIGPALGGTTVTIQGKDFRQTMDGYPNKQLAVHFGATQVDPASVTYVDYYTLKVVTPANDPGKVDVKVENPDGEISSPSGSFTYISNPTLTGVAIITSEGGEGTADTISTAGGQTLQIKGTGFMEGCKVYFSPVITATSDTTTANFLYLLSNGALVSYTLTSGDASSDVKVIDANTITVTTPAGKLNANGIIVVNPDEGATPIFSDIKYTLPQPEAPTGVSAILVHDDHNDTDRFIKLQWNAITGASAYEVYVVSGDNTDFVGSTIYTSLMYTNLEPNTSYRFIIKAVGDYGSSPPSEKSERVHTGDRVGPPDEDGKLGQKTSMVTSGSNLTINVGTEDNGGSINIDLTGSQYTGVHQVQVNLPARVIYASNGSNIKIAGSDFQLQFKSEVFHNSSLDGHQSDRQAGVRLCITPYSGDPGTQGGNCLSTVYQLQATNFVGQDSTALNQLGGYMLFTINYDNAKAQLRHYSSMDLCQLNSASGLWQPVSYGSANIGGLWMVNQMGLYSIIGSRR